MLEGQHLMLTKMIATKAFGTVKQEQAMFEAKYD